MTERGRGVVGNTGVKQVRSLGQLFPFEEGASSRIFMLPNLFSNTCYSKLNLSGESLIVYNGRKARTLYVGLQRPGQHGHQRDAQRVWRAAHLAADDGRRRNTASAPGEPPAVLLQPLQRRSILRARQQVWYQPCSGHVALFHLGHEGGGDAQDTLLARAPPKVSQLGQPVPRG